MISLIKDILLFPIRIFKLSRSQYLYNAYVRNPSKQGFGEIGQHSQIAPGSTLAVENIFLEDYTRLQDRTNLISYKGKLIVKKYSAVGSQCIIIPGNHRPTVGLPQFLSVTHINDVDEEIVINEDCWVGAGCILLAHLKIGRGAVIGAGSIVTKDIPPYAVVVGSPTRIIATRFSIDQIIQHEKILYPKEERMTREELEQLFEMHYKDKRVIGTSDISMEDFETLKNAKVKYGIKDYSKE